MAFDYKEKFSVAGKKHRYRCSTGTFQRYGRRSVREWR